MRCRGEDGVIDPQSFEVGGDVVGPIFDVVNLVRAPLVTIRSVSMSALIMFRQPTVLRVRVRGCRRTCRSHWERHRLAVN